MEVWLCDLPIFRIVITIQLHYQYPHTYSDFSNYNTDIYTYDRAWTHQLNKQQSWKRTIPFHHADTKNKPSLLPFKFFTPLQPTSVRILAGHDQRPTGEGEVDFASHGDALKAMERDKKYMGKRYVELFLLSEPGNSRAANPALPGKNKCLFKRNLARPYLVTFKCE